MKILLTLLVTTGLLFGDCYKVLYDHSVAAIQISHGASENMDAFYAHIELQNLNNRRKSLADFLPSGTKLCVIPNTYSAWNYVVKAKIDDEIYWVNTAAWATDLSGHHSLDKINN